MLSSLFGPLYFGLRPAALPFHITYLKYLCATNAIEHVLLTFICWKDSPSNESSGLFHGPGSVASLSVPTWPTDQIRGYLAMLSDPATQLRKYKRLQPHCGAHTVYVVSIRPDLYHLSHLRSIPLAPCMTPMFELASNTILQLNRCHLLSLWCKALACRMCCWPPKLTNICSLLPLWQGQPLLTNTWHCV